MAMSGTTRALLILGLVMLGLAICVLAMMIRHRSVARAEEVLTNLCSQLGLLPVANSASALKYFREYPSVGSPLRLAAGRLYGLHVETCLVPIVARSEKGRTLVGVQCSTPLGFEVGLSRRDAVSGITNSLFGQANGVGSVPLFENYDGWGPSPDLQRLFNTEVQAAIRAFPHTFEQVLVYGQDVVMVWREIEADASVMKQAFQLGASLCQAARKS